MSRRPDGVRRSGWLDGRRLGFRTVARSRCGLEVRGGRLPAEDLCIAASWRSLFRVEVADRDQRQAQVANLVEQAVQGCLLDDGPGDPDLALIDLFNLAPAQAARLALAQGRVADAARWIRNRGLGPEDELSYPREREYLVLARVLVASQTPERALRLLERLGAAAAAEQRTGGLIEIRVVQALARAAAGDETGALAALAEALTLAAPEGYLRVFVRLPAFELCPLKKEVI